ncbi:SpoIIE family protein phosphatase [Kineococcus rhizosphaerae]|uniref:PAS domain S-box-containing protein n=1 Tax=Kineococcus rhizosphaerae TaxID=559628 RepID=A0A2T0R214_9ACTN|nr:SpoIIE family protein phosphatase [Kineococcus rhizosphaerae]PRY13555.1 PAS domain S-box-containing protein [Kineococcus rhizosphaerae]
MPDVRPGAPADRLQGPVPQQGVAQPAAGGDQRDTRAAVDVALLPAVFSGALVAMIALDRDGTVTALTPSVERLLGWTESELLGTPLHRHVRHQRADGRPVPAEDSPVLAGLREARPAGRDDEYLVRKDGSLLPVTWAFAPTVLARTPVGGVLTFYDAQAARAQTARQRQRLAEVEESNARLALLADVSHVLGESDDVVEGLRAVARRVVPVLADWVCVDVLGEDGTTLERVALAHRDPVLDAVGATHLGPLPPLRPGMTSALAQVLQGLPLLHQQEVPATAVDELAADRLALVRELGAAEGITAPLRARGRTLGAITLVRTDGTRPYRQEDRDFVADLAARAAALLDTTRLLGHQVRRAEQMQRALLPELADRIGPLALSGLYRPASDLAQVGGDWYDAFALPDGSTGLVIGDVAGHDLHAATRMGAIRHKLRALAGDRVAPASEVVARLDRVVQRFAPQDLVTLLYARVTAAGPAGVRLEWSNAGHPPPLLLSPGGPARLLDDVVDLPVGVDDLPRADAATALEDGSTLVLYSDGLVERPRESLTTGLERLLRVAADLGTVPLRGLGQDLLTGMRPTGLDDIAVLAVRLGPQGADAAP